MIYKKSRKKCQLDPKERLNLSFTNRIIKVKTILQKKDKTLPAHLSKTTPLVIQKNTFSTRHVHLFSPNSLLLGVFNSFLRCVRPLRHCWCPPFSSGHVAFLFMCLPGLSLLVSSLFRWPCSISVHLSPRCVTAGVRPFPLAM